MLVGTFQGIPDASHGGCEGVREELSQVPEEERSDNDRMLLRMYGGHRTGEAEFGFEPVWLLPMPTLADAFAHAAMTAPFFTTCFLAYDIDEEELIRLDAREHENRKGLGDWHSLETDSDDISTLEYVVDSRKLDGRPCWMYSPALSRADRHSFEEIPLSDEVLEFYEYLNEPLFAYFDGVLEGKFPYTASVVGGAGASRKRALYLQLIKDEFLFARLPLVFAQLQAALSPEPVEVSSAYFAAISRDMDRFQRLRLRFVDLANASEPISYFDWRAIYDGFRGMVCEDVDVLQVLCEDGEPRRNDHCPCGSGRKWKQCHGRLHHEVRCKPFC